MTKTTAIFVLVVVFSVVFLLGLCIVVGGVIGSVVVVVVCGGDGSVVTIVLVFRIAIFTGLCNYLSFPRTDYQHLMWMIFFVFAMS